MGAVSIEGFLGAYALQRALRSWTYIYVQGFSAIGLEVRALLGGSWVVIRGVRSRVAIVIAHTRGLITQHYNYPYTSK